jgi:molecular chaperone DnaK (HSP70)
VSAEVLKSLRRIAEGSLGIRALPAEGLQAVLTHPAYFNQDQKEATLEAAKMAQLDVVELLSEPLAAAYAYNFHLAENQVGG